MASMQTAVVGGARGALFIAQNFSMRKKDKMFFNPGTVVVPICVLRCFVLLVFLPSVLDDRNNKKVCRKVDVSIPRQSQALFSF